MSHDLEKSSGSNQTNMFMVPRRPLLLLCFVLFLIFITTFNLGDGITSYDTLLENSRNGRPPTKGTADLPTYKPDRPTSPPIVDNFPLAAAASSSADLPPIPPWNRPPQPHVPEKTPLFIGFTRNWPMLQQTVVSYITAGWPAKDIYVFENTGTMKSNELGRLSLQNPFFLNHTRLKMFDVNIITTPTLLTFAQLQNFFLWTAMEKGFDTYFWGHMDVIAMSFEGRHIGSNTEDGYERFETLYTLAVQALRTATSTYYPDPNSSNSSKPWAARFFAYDRLALVNRAAFEKIGGWDTAIPYYRADCDMHDRLKMNGFEYNEEDVVVGDMMDVGNSLNDLIVLYRKKDTVNASFTPEPKPEIPKVNGTEQAQVDVQVKEWITDTPGSPAYKKLVEVVGKMAKYKNERGGGGRNIWQTQQTGGEGEPYYRDSEGFEKSMQMLMQHGREVYAEKWGHKECGLLEVGRKPGDEWRVEHDWE